MNADPVDFVDPVGLREPSAGNSYTFTIDHPLNQHVLDTLMHYDTSHGTQSCANAAIINAYAAHNETGITANEIRQALQNTNGRRQDFMNPDGSPKDINKESKSLASAMNQREYLQVQPRVADAKNIGPTGAIIEKRRPNYLHFVYGDPTITLDSLNPYRPAAKAYKNVAQWPIVERPMPRPAEDKKGK